ncbi:hypothetical protein HMI54_005391 [Coelomomyces lativittatus]|nr:hypothetical protein HMI55_001542 [Coelomomyces lativittatus]KAJ1506050.1 hypothetical protein HMI54_005391 [Coelomomyces lativittatus]KAJ1514619.1 hypothetical protein HMI56_000080 [Coelomomyces lativittatus]
MASSFFASLLIFIPGYFSSWLTTSTTTLAALSFIIGIALLYGLVRTLHVVHPLSTRSSIHPTRPFPFHSLDKLLLIIAHPDDECMFFGPALLTLLKHKIPTFILCLSNGNQGGIGELRGKELLKSGQCLGVHRDQIRLINSNRLEDGESWELGDILSHVNTSIKDWQITQILTFDEYGVSGHPNHISIAVASKNLTIPVWQLSSLSLFRKYLPIRHHVKSDWETHLSSSEKHQVRMAMRQHRTQMVWFRWLYIYFSIYIQSNWLNRI